jgi:hypothetical protein
MFGESYSSCYTEHNKIGFAIFGVFYDFKSILQVSAITHKCLKTLFATRTLERLKPHNHTLSLRKTPQKEFKPRNAALGPWGRRGWPKSGDLAGGLGRGRRREGSRGREGPACVRFWGRQVTGELSRRGRAAVAAGGFAPAKIGAGQGNKQRCDPQDVLGQELGALMGSGCKRKEGLIVAA